MWHLQTQNGVAKTHRRGDWFDIWLCARNRRCHFDFCQCQMTRGKIVLDGKSKENLEKNCGIQFFFLVFSSFWTVCDYPKFKQQQRLRFRERLAFHKFGTSTNFHTNVGSADIAAFLQFQTVSDLFQTSLGCPQISIQM